MVLKKISLKNFLLVFKMNHKHIRIWIIVYKVFSNLKFKKKILKNLK